MTIVPSVKPLSGGAELRTVEEVERFDAELSGHTVIHLEDLACREIEVRCAGAAELAIHTAFVAEGELTRQREACLVDPVVDFALLGTADMLVATANLVGTNGTRSKQAKVVRVVVATSLNCNRHSAVESGDARHSPAANERIDETVGMTKELFAVSKWKIEAVVDNQVMGEILQAERPLSGKVGIVLHDALAALIVVEAAGVVGIAHQPGVGVRELQYAVIDEGAFVGDLERVID